MDAPKCRICGERHWGLCQPSVRSVNPVEHSIRKTKPLNLSTSTDTSPKIIPAAVQPAASNATITRFDRTGYQKEYMKKWRAKKKVNK